MNKRQTRARRHCAGCGELKTRSELRFGAFCSMRCAADAAATAQEAGSADFHCTICGEVGCGREHDGDEGNE